MTHLLLPSTVTRKLLIAQASYFRITKLRARLTPKCKKLNIRKCGPVFADRVTIRQNGINAGDFKDR